MTKNEHRKQGLENAYHLLSKVDASLAGHTENQGLRELVKNLKEKLAESRAELDKLYDVLFDEEM